MSTFHLSPSYKLHPNKPRLRLRESVLGVSFVCAKAYYIRLSLSLSKMRYDFGKVLNKLNQA